jgi:hypothetical protein
MRKKKKMAEPWQYAACRCEKNNKKSRGVFRKKPTEGENFACDECKSVVSCSGRTEVEPNQEIDMETKRQQLLYDISMLDMHSKTLSNPMMRKQAYIQKVKLVRILRRGSPTPSNLEVDLEKLCATHQADIETQRQKILRHIRKRDDR